MFFSPLSYDEPLFRPPSEGRSLIFQVTTGCSWNRCSFCEMYTSRKFSIKIEEAISREVREAARWSPGAKKVFLADGNAMVLGTAKLLKILEMLNAAFPGLTRVSAYAGSRDLENKSAAELKELRDAGLKLIYVGIESGDDEVLSLVNKGETAESAARNLLKARSAGIKTSVMILTGLGGRKYSRNHAIESARLVTTLQPEYLSTLVLSFPYGIAHYRSRFNGDFIEMDREHLLRELHLFISELKLSDSIFRSDHASNYLALKGILNRDRERLLHQIEEVLKDPGSHPLREEWQRGL